MPRSYTLPLQRIAFDDPRLVADAGLLLPATLARRLGLAELLERHVDLGAAAGRAHVADKGLTLIMSALAGGDCIDDVDALRAGATAAVLGHRVAAPSTVGTYQPRAAAPRLQRRTAARHRPAHLGRVLEPERIPAEGACRAARGQHGPLRPEDGLGAPLADRGALHRDEAHRGRGLHLIAASVALAVGKGTPPSRRDVGGSAGSGAAAGDHSARAGLAQAEDRPRYRTVAN